MRIRVTPYKYINLHHTAGHETNTQAVRVEHMGPPNSWGDIGYNAVIESAGTVGVGRDTKYCGAHNPGLAPDGSGYTMNDVAYAISHIGNFMEEIMSDIQFWASIKFCAQKCKEFDIVPSKDTIRPHKADYATDCPGDNFPYDRYIEEVIKIYKGMNDALRVAVLLFSKEDYWAGTDVSAKSGNCALFIRPADRSVPAEAMSAQKLIVVGGPTAKHPNEILLSGNTKYDTAQEVAKYLG